MKALHWIGAAFDDLRGFPLSARSEAGTDLRLVQQGVEPREIRNGTKDDSMTKRCPMRKSARENKITASSGNVFSDLGFDDAEAQVLALRADLMAQLEKQIKARKLTQVVASKLLGVSQSRVSDLARGKVEKFSLDTLVQFAAKLGKPAKIELAR